MDHAQSPKKDSPLLPFVVIALAASCALLPTFWFGTPSGHDFEFHVNSWIEVLGQWKHGIIYPHWSAFAHFGYGEVRFIFYPPASWTLGSILGAIFPWKFVPFAYNWIALTLAGLSMFSAARRALPARDALFAAAFYALNPYFLVIVYWRSAMAELLAGAYIPLLLTYALELSEDRARTIAPLSLLIAAGWLTNVPSAVMMVYTLGLLGLWTSISRRSWKPFAYAGTSILLGLGISAIYLIPVWHQREWVSLSQVLSPGVRPLENFLFSFTGDADHNRFNRLVSVIAVCEMIILASSLWIGRKSKEKAWRPLLLLSIVCTLLMFRVTLPTWNHMPELRYVQFPWRWLLILNAAFAIAVMIAVRRWWLRGMALIVVLGAVAFSWRFIQAPWWDTSADIQEMVNNQNSGIGNEGTDEYVPAAADPYEIDQNVPLAAYQGEGLAKIRVEKWQAERRKIVVHATAPGDLVLRLFNYPAWKTEVNGRSVQTHSTERAGQMVIPLVAGENHIEVQFVGGWDRKLGTEISVLAIVAVLALVIKFRQAPDNEAA